MTAIDSDRDGQDGPEAENATAEFLLQELRAAVERAAADPFGNPVLATGLAISRLMDEDELREPQIAALIRDLRDRAFLARARRLAAYTGLARGAAAAEVFGELAARLVRPDPQDSPVRLADFRASVERTRYAAVFTAHPTFSLPRDIAANLAALASGDAARLCYLSHRPSKPSLAQEFDEAMAAISHARHAIDRLNAAILQEAGKTWPDRWRSFVPRPLIVASWVGFDTDGRNDIGWCDSLRYRLALKQAGLEHALQLLGGLAPADPLCDRLRHARAATMAQIAACPASPDTASIGRLRAAMTDDGAPALLGSRSLEPLFETALAASDDAAALRICLARAGLAAHGLALAHTHMRLNAAQIGNAIRVALGIAAPVSDRAQRRSLLAALNTALEEVQAVPPDFADPLQEGASASRLMMLASLIVRHVDQDSPVRFLIAETETGATLLSALWLARRFGVAEHVEISPLFETADALEHGPRVLEEALRSPHYRAYLKQHGRMALQFGYSDSGRYVGQLAASYMIERLRMKLAQLLRAHALTDVELVLFDTHGESIGRGGHPGSVLDRLRYLSPDPARGALRDAGIRLREESSFQGGDGYLLFGTQALADGTIAMAARHALQTPDTTRDPIYTESDFSADFFSTIAASMQELVDDPGYAALLGAFGPALLDPSGSRPSARQSDTGGPELIRHPRELRAIPNNAILQQLGWCANSLQGIGRAAARAPELFADMREQSPRFARALALAAHALQHSSLDVLRAVISLIDPGSWLDRAAQARRPGRARALMDVAEALESLQLWAPAQAMFRKIQADHLALRSAWPDAPGMGEEELLLHALRIALIGRIWLLATAIPEFSPQFGTTREALFLRLLRLDVPAALDLLGRIFPAESQGNAAYLREHERIFAPIGRLFGMVREIGAAITHANGALG